MFSLYLSFVDDILLTRRALHSELSKTEADAQTDAKAVEETETETKQTAPAAVASETEAKEWMKMIVCVAVDSNSAPQVRPEQV